MLHLQRRPVFLLQRIETGQLVETYARSKFEDTRCKAQKFGARGTP